MDDHVEVVSCVLCFEADELDSMHTIDLGADRQISRPEVTLCMGCVVRIAGYAAQLALVEDNGLSENRPGHLDYPGDLVSASPGSEASDLVVLGDRSNGEGDRGHSTESEVLAGAGETRPAEANSASEGRVESPKKNSRSGSHKK